MAAAGAGYTLMGAAAVLVDPALTGGNYAQIVARLWDVGPDGQQDVDLAYTFLQPPAHRQPGTRRCSSSSERLALRGRPRPKLELLATDNDPGLTGGYAHTSNDQQDVTVKDLKLRLPVREPPGALDGLVGAAAAKQLPKGDALARDFRKLSNPVPHLVKNKLKIKRFGLSGKVICPQGFDRCHDVSVTAKLGHGVTVQGGFSELAGGLRRKVKLPWGRSAVAYRCRPHHHTTVKAKVKISATELDKPVKSKAKIKAC